MELKRPFRRSREASGEPTLRRARIRGRIAAGAALAVAVAVIVVLVLRNQGSPSTPAATAGTTGLGVATVQRRNLVASDTESGTLGYANPQTVYNRISGTITWLPSVGRVIRAGQVLYRVADKPVILMYGSTPAFRDLDSHDPPGSDITQLNRNLVKLGFDADGIVVDDEWQAATTVGVQELQEALGVTPTGKLALGRIVFLPGPQLVSEVDATVGGTGGGSAGSSASDPVAAPSATEFVSLDRTPTTSTTTSTQTTTTSTETTKTHATTTGTGKTSTTGPAPTHTGQRPTPPTTGHGGHERVNREPGNQQAGSQTGTQAPGTHSGTPSSGTPQSNGALQSAISQLSSQIAALRHEMQAQNSGHPNTPGSGKKSPGASNKKPQNSEHPSSTGDPSATEILQTSSPTLVVTVDLPASSQSEAVVGKTVTVLLPNGGSAKGKITSVSRVASSSGSSGSGGSGGSGGSSGSGGSGSGDSGSGSSTIPVTIKLEGHHADARLDQAAVSVEFVQSSARHVLSVPVTALVATSGTTYALQEASPPHRLIPVHTGLFAAGDVQVSGSGVVPGLHVTDSEG